MIKMDIEGAEYKLLNEAYDSNALCECAQHGVRIDLRVEIHPKVSQSVYSVGSHEKLGPENTWWGKCRFGPFQRYCPVSIERLWSER